MSLFPQLPWPPREVPGRPVVRASGQDGVAPKGSAASLKDKDGVAPKGSAGMLTTAVASVKDAIVSTLGPLGGAAGKDKEPTQAEKDAGEPPSLYTLSLSFSPSSGRTLFTHSHQRMSYAVGAPVVTDAFTCSLSQFLIFLSLRPIVGPCSPINQHGSTVGAPVVTGTFESRHWVDVKRYLSTRQIESILPFKVHSLYVPCM